MKLVINSDYGGFGLSHEAILRYFELIGAKPRIEERPTSIIPYYYYVDDEFWYDDKIDRADPALVQVVEELGEKANGRCAKLKVVDIPDDIEYYIDEYDGIESVHEKHRIW